MACSEPNNSWKDLRPTTPIRSVSSTGGGCRGRAGKHRTELQRGLGAPLNHDVGLHGQPTAKIHARLGLLSDLAASVRLLLALQTQRELSFEQCSQANAYTRS